MENQNIVKQFLRAVLHELFRLKTIYNLIASIILLGVVALGYVWQESYVSTATLSVSQNASAGDNKAQLNLLKNVFDTHAFQEDALSILQASVFDGGDAHALDEEFVGENSELTVLPRGIAEIRFKADTPSKAKNSLSIVVNILLERFQPKEDLESLHERGDELRRQELSLRASIRETEEQLRLIGGMAAGVLGTASTRVTSLREALQDVEINLSAVNATIAGIARKIDEEEALLNHKQRLIQLEAQKEKNQEALDEALELYSSASQEVISLQNASDNITLEIAKLKENQPEGYRKNNVNDILYEKLRQRLTLQELERESLESKKSSLQRLLASENKKAQQDEDQFTQAQALNEHAIKQKTQLDVVQREISLLNQTLKEQKKNDNRFIVLDSPSLPERYSGLGFVEFLLLGPVLAFGIPFLIASIIVLTDSSIRTARALKHVQIDIPVLGVIPHYNSPKTLRLFRKAVIGLVAWVSFVLIVYLTVGVIGLKA